MPIHQIKITTANHKCYRVSPPQTNNAFDPTNGPARPVARATFCPRPTIVFEEILGPIDNNNNNHNNPNNNNHNNTTNNTTNNNPFHNHNETDTAKYGHKRVAATALHNAAGFYPPRHPPTETTTTIGNNRPSID